MVGRRGRATRNGSGLQEPGRARASGGRAFFFCNPPMKIWQFVQLETSTSEVKSSRNTLQVVGGRAGGRVWRGETRGGDGRGNAGRRPPAPAPLNPASAQHSRRVQRRAPALLQVLDDEALAAAGQGKGGGRRGTAARRGAGSRPAASGSGRREAPDAVAPASASSRFVIAHGRDSSATAAAQGPLTR